MIKPKIKLSKKYYSKIKTQDYSKKVITGVQIINLNTLSGEDGYFIELARLTEDTQIQGLEQFQIRQLSWSKITPHGIKGWHIHYNQEDLWFIPPDEQLLIGLVDLREGSKTKDKIMRITAGNHRAMLILIPKGVAHGYTNLSNTPSSILYLTNQQFDINNPDEYRLPWDFFGKDFWEVQKG